MIIEIINKKGLHARAAAKFVKTVSAFDAEVSVIKLKNDKEPQSEAVGGTSILGLMMLGADPGSQLDITADGAQSAEALDAIKELITSKFGEDA